MSDLDNSGRQYRFASFILYLAGVDDIDADFQPHKLKHFYSDQSMQILSPTLKRRNL